MSNYSQLLDEIEKLQDKTFDPELVGFEFLGINDIMKNIIASKNPKMSKDEVNAIVDSDEQDTKRDNSPKRQIKQEAKELKREAKLQLSNFFRETKNLIIKGVTSGIQANSSVPASGLAAVSIPPNPPLAISYIMTVIDTILNFISQLQTIINYTTVFDKLHLVMDDANLQKISGVINSQLSTIKSLQNNVEGLKNLVAALKNTAKNPASATASSPISLTDLDKITDPGKINPVPSSAESPVFYDVTLSDGGTLLNLTEDEIKQLSSSASFAARYELIIKDLEDLGSVIGI